MHWGGSEDPRRRFYDQVTACVRPKHRTYTWAGCLVVPITIRSLLLQNDFLFLAQPARQTAYIHTFPRGIPCAPQFVPHCLLVGGTCLFCHVPRRRRKCRPHISASYKFKLASACCPHEHSLEWEGSGNGGRGGALGNDVVFAYRSELYTLTLSPRSSFSRAWSARCRRTRSRSVSACRRGIRWMRDHIFSRASSLRNTRVSFFYPVELCQPWVVIEAIRMPQGVDGGKARLRV